MTGTAVDDRSIIDRLLTRYPDDADIVWAVERLEPRSSRIRRRDAAIRSALKLFGGKPSVAAKALAAALEAYESGMWRTERRLVVLSEETAPTERHRLLHVILKCNGDKPLGWRTIFNICKE